jgi:hypothetical protein
MPLSQFDERVPVLLLNLIVAANTTSFVNIAGGSPYGRRLDAVYATNTDSIDHAVELNVQDGMGGTSFLGGVNVPAGSGVTLPSVELLSSLLAPGQPFLILQGSQTLNGAVAVAMVGISELDFTALGGDF